MSDEYSPPQARDLPPGRLDQRAEHLHFEITHHQRRRVPLPFGSQFLGGRRFRLYATAGACALLAAALSVVFIPKSSNAPLGGGAGGLKGGVELVPETSVVGATFMVSVQLEVHPSYGDDGTAWISVRRFQGQPGTDLPSPGSDEANNESQVVYKEHVQLTPPDTGDFLSTWSGALSPSDWAGGCASGSFYNVEVDTGGSPIGNTSYADRWFTCLASTG